MREGMKRVLVVGAGGVGSVVTQKLAQCPDRVDIVLASRTLEKCERIRDRIARPIDIAQVDAADARQVVALIERHRPDVLINVALPYQDLAVMDACLQTGVHYLDTANYEPPDVAKFEYRWQWAYHDRFRERRIMALLGCGFDPGMTNAYCAYARKHLFDRIETIDILDCNGGDHGHPFATNFNSEINIREITQPGRYWEEGKWVEIPPFSEAIEFDFPGVGVRRAYLLFHEELESIVRHFAGLRRARFWMTFGDRYLNYLRVLQDVGMTRIDPVLYEGHKVVPLKFLQSLLPDPASLGVNYRGRTSIGCAIAGDKDGKLRRVFIYNVCEHAAAYAETGTQAVSYTTGVPAACGAMLMLGDAWRADGVFNVEQLDPDPLMESVATMGLPWQITEM